MPPWGKSLRRRFCVLRAVGSLVSTVQIRSYVHPLCDIWAVPHGYNFLLRSSPHKPNRARRAQSAHVPNCGYVPNRGDGGGQRIICYQWLRATMRRQRRRAAGAVRAPQTRSVRGVGSHARVSPAAPAMPGTYSVCVAVPYALFFASSRFI